MGGEYICVTGCIIAQLTRAWIEPFQPNNPLATNTLYMCMGTVYGLYTYTNTHCIHTQTQVEPFQTNNPIWAQPLYLRQRRFT